jgi:ABC-type cobalamin/Fe3+-siderophores transport systems, ATPase components
MPLGGDVLLRGRELKSFSSAEFAQEVGVVLTEKTNAGGLTVYDLVSLGRHPFTGFFGQLKEKDKECILNSLNAVGIYHKANNYVSELSDGERQKVMIAKVLAQECPIIILDEPTAFLDVTARIETMVLLRNLAHKQGKTILLSTHDIDSAIQMGDCLWLLDKNSNIKYGSPEDLIMNGNIAEFFNKKGIVFNQATGTLNSSTENNIPIGVEGDINTAYWVGNALIRNGFKPSEISEKHINIHCFSKNKITATLVNGTENTFTNVADLTYFLSNL